MSRSQLTPKNLVILVLALGAGACSKDDKATGPNLVTVSGIVRSIDTGQPVAGIRVTLLGTNYSDEVATGTDGAYSLKVPQGSVLHLHTDDFNTAQNDLWFPLINVESKAVVANANVPDFPIHCCPRTSCASPISPSQAGSVAMWDYYLQNLDQSSGDRFAPATSAASGGILAILMGDCKNGSDSSDSMMVTSQDPDFPIAYANPDFFGGCPPSEVLYPPTRTVSNPSGIAFSFGNAANTSQTVTLEAHDGSTAPYRAPHSPVSVPVRPGTISLVWFTTVNGAEGTFKNYACACINSAVFCTP